MIDYYSLPNTKNEHALAVVRSRETIRQLMLKADAHDRYDYKITDLIIKKRGAGLAITWVVDYTAYEVSLNCTRLMEEGYTPSANAPSAEWFVRQAQAFNNEIEFVNGFLSASDERFYDELSEKAITVETPPRGSSAQAEVETTVIVKSRAAAEDVQRVYAHTLMKKVEAAPSFEDDVLEALRSNRCLSAEQVERVEELNWEHEQEREDAENLGTITALQGLQSHEDEGIRDQAEDLMGSFLMGIAAG